MEDMCDVYCCDIDADAVRYTSPDIYLQNWGSIAPSLFYIYNSDIQYVVYNII